MWHEYDGAREQKYHKHVRDNYEVQKIKVIFNMQALSHYLLLCLCLYSFNEDTFDCSQTRGISKEGEAMDKQHNLFPVTTAKNFSPCILTKREPKVHMYCLSSSQPLKHAELVLLRIKTFLMQSPRNLNLEPGYKLCTLQIMPKSALWHKEARSASMHLLGVLKPHY